MLVDTVRPYIYATRIFGEGGQVIGGLPNEAIPAQLTIGVRYVVDVVLQPGSGYGWDSVTECNAGDMDCASVEVNPDLRVPGSLNIVNPIGATFAEIKPTFDTPETMTCTNNSQCTTQNHGQGDCNAVTQRCNWHRRFAFTCGEPGSFGLGFQVRNAPPYLGGSPYNFDYGLRVQCVSASTGTLWSSDETRMLACGMRHGADRREWSARRCLHVWHYRCRRGDRGRFRVRLGPDGYERQLSLPSATGGPLVVTVTPPAAVPTSKRSRSM